MSRSGLMANQSLDLHGDAQALGAASSVAVSLDGESGFVASTRDSWYGVGTQ